MIGAESLAAPDDSRKPILIFVALPEGGDNVSKCRAELRESRVLADLVTTLARQVQ